MGKISKDAKGVFQHSGRLDDSSDLSSLAKTPQRPLMLNFLGTDAVTSLGLRAMRDLIAAMPNGALIFRECPAILVDLFNMAPEMLRRVGHIPVIESFYAPYGCDRCKVEAEVLVTAAELIEKKGFKTLPLKRCHQCRGQLTLVTDEDDFLAFLNET